MKIVKSELLFVLLTVAVFGTAVADTRYAGASLQLGIGARASALGGAGAGLYGQVNQYYYNPASLALLSRPGLSLMYAPTFGSVRDPMAQQHYAGFCLPLPGGGTLAVNWTRFSVDEIPLFPSLSGAAFADRLNNRDLRPDGESMGTFHNIEDVFYFSFARNFNFLIPLGWLYVDLPVEMPIGLNFKVIRHRLHKASASGLGLDLGTMIKFSLGRLLDKKSLGELVLGYSAMDITNTPMVWDTRHEDRVRYSQRFGFSYEQPLWNPNYSINLHFNRYRKYEYENLLGLEFEFYGYALRLGRNENGLTAGTGLDLFKFQVDYAFVDLGFDQAHRLSCSYSFK
ncbi:hypothetical protein GF406_20005 [candidate division KSB1 bacterium]|nr:hypothetical protein [candidate division KSB1 bacterium]